MVFLYILTTIFLIFRKCYVRRAASTDLIGRITIHEYDSLGRLVKTIDPMSQATKQTWNAHDQLTSLTDAKGNTHKFEYDKAGRLIKETRPMGGAILYAYDAAGQLTQCTDAGGNTRSYAYDKAGRMVQEEHKLQGTETDQRISYQYDADGLLTAYEQKDGQQNLISSANYDKDAQGRTTQNKVTYNKVDNTGSFSFTVGQSYNADGQLAGHTYPDGSAGQYSYDKGRLSLVTLPDQSQIRYGNYQWLTATRIETPGATKTISVDALQRPLSIEIKNAAAQILASRHYQYDKAGNIIQIDSDLGTTEYGYDPLDRLTKAAPDQKLQDLGLPTEQYQYDAVHNRSFSSHQMGPWSYNADNQLASYPRLKPFDITAQSVQTQVEYTPQGHTARESSDKGERTHSYNAAERLIRFAHTDTGQITPSIDAQYRYDPLGRRIGKTVKEGQTTKITYFFYSDMGLLGEANEQGQMTRAYAFNPQKAQQRLWGTDPIWQADVSQAQLANMNTSIHYLHTDHLGMPIMATNRQGAKTWKIVTEAFGAMGISGQSQVEINMRLPGQYWDAESGNHYNFRRDYIPLVGRYSEIDPIGLSGGINFYIYDLSEPLRHIDPEGKFTIEKDCCNQVPDLMQDINNACDLVGTKVGDLKLKTCITERCKSAHVSCDGMMCWRMNYFGDSVYGWNSPGSSTANLCLTANKNANSFMGWGCAVIHEWAHSCGWDHGGGFGIPDGTRDLNDFVQNCRNNWNPVNGEPSRGK
ncbi:RHS repeat-associated core domain-containing protein [Delftia deserti]|uniref:RHS repeat-associated core domain-containing protein n=2 Tax=Delftia deserti TaxID=1651218 RepID=A0ABW5EHP7_9BURK